MFLRGHPGRVRERDSRWNETFRLTGAWLLEVEGSQGTACGSLMKSSSRALSLPSVAPRYGAG